MIPGFLAITYNLNDGTDFKGTYLRNGNVTVANLTCYSHGDPSQCPDQVVQDQLAHSYGEDTMGPDSTSPSDCGAYSDVQSIPDINQNFPYFCRRNTTAQEFAYRFNEYNPNDTPQAYPHFTNRTITASSGPCNEYNQTGSQKTTIGDDSGNAPNALSALNMTYTNGTYNGSISIPTSAMGREGTTYIYRDLHIPADATTYGNGPRGLIMWAYRNPGASADSSQFYECPITISTVANVRNPAHNISDAMAREAAASIALQGQYHSNPDNQRNNEQWQWYANG